MNATVYEPLAMLSRLEAENECLRQSHQQLRAVHDAATHALYEAMRELAILSEHDVQPCPECVWAGMLDCMNCGGAGYLDSAPGQCCPVCKGERQVICWKCRGEGVAL
jgi:hypothetical protein